MNWIDIAWTFAAAWFGGAVALWLVDDFLRQRDPANDYDGREVLGIALWPVWAGVGMLALLGEEVVHQTIKFCRWIGSARKRSQLSSRA